MLRIAALCFVLGFATANTAAADDWWDDIERSGFTVGLSASAGGVLDFKQLERPGVQIDEDVSAGLHAKLGYRLQKWFGADLHVEYLKQRTESRGGNTRPNVEADIVTFTTDLKLLLPRWANAQFFVLAGAGMINADDEFSFASRLGGGLDFYFTRSIGMNWGASYVIVPDGTLNEWDYVTADVGFFYRF